MLTLDINNVRYNLWHLKGGNEPLFFGSQVTSGGNDEMLTHNINS